jgi:alkanesulfonate monooxygenase SsuD/methylene tetrahydromethanopterin reductase-like flavin-dependent oxidoreductase (luciferase family)
VVSTGISLSTIGIGAPALVEAARRAEAAGFSAVWCYDHLSGAVLRGDRSLDVWAVLGAVATATERVSVGPLVANVTTRHPAQLAVAAATIQSLSGGRLRLGLGAGAGPGSPFAAEMEIFQLAPRPADERRARLEESVAYLRALWGGAERFDGHWAGFSDVRGVLIPSPSPPIILGANGPRLAEVAGRVADGVNFHAAEEDLAGLVATVDRAATTAGRPAPEVSVEGPFEPDWIDRGSPTRQRLAGYGVAEVMIAWRAELGLDRIDEAGRWL